jgi:hypothetical protein
VGGDQAGGDLAWGESDGLQYAVLPNALADRQQRDRDESRDGDEQEYGVQRVRRFSCMESANTTAARVTATAAASRMARCRRVSRSFSPVRDLL